MANVQYINNSHCHSRSALTFASRQKEKSKQTSIKQGKLAVP